MKVTKLITTVIFVQVVAVIVASAQVTYISSTNKPTEGFLPIGSDMWRARGFSTGMHSLGYRLDSIRLLMGDASGTPSGLTVSLYSRNEVFPGEHIWTLDGPSNPSESGVYSYTGTDITLLPSTGYFIVVNAAQPLTDGSFSLAELAIGSVHERIDGWVLGHQAFSTDGLAWERLGNTLSFQFDVSATAIPEPSHLALLFGTGVLFIAMGLRRKRYL